jgi:hypothetical protein
VLSIEGGHFRSVQAGTHAAAGSESAPPAFLRKWYRGVESEKVDDIEITLHFWPTPRHFAATTGTRPLRVVFQHQGFGAVRNFVLVRQPTKVARDEATWLPQQTRNFATRPFEIEVSPTLAGCDYVEAGCGKARVFGRSDSIVNAQAGLLGAFLGGLDLTSVDVDSDDLGSIFGELLSQEADARAKVQHLLPWQPDAAFCQPLVKLRRIIRPMLGVIGGGAAPLDWAAAVVGKMFVEIHGLQQTAILSGVTTSGLGINVGRALESGYMGFCPSAISSPFVKEIDHVSPGSVARVSGTSFGRFG